MGWLILWVLLHRWYSLQCMDGPPIESKDDPLVTQIHEIGQRVLCAALPGAHLVKIFPVMKHLPTWMAPWKKWGLEWYKKDSEMFQGFYDGVAETFGELKNQNQNTKTLRKTIRAKTIPNPPSHLHLLNIRKNMDCQTMSLLGLLELCCKTILHCILGRDSIKSFFSGAGAELVHGVLEVSSSCQILMYFLMQTATALSVFMLAMALYPDVMHKAQHQIDVTVGAGRLPTFADAPNLPYLQAMVMEVLRWRPVGLLG